MDSLRNSCWSTSQWITECWYFHWVSRARFERKVWSMRFLTLKTIWNCQQSFDTNYNRRPLLIMFNNFHRALEMIEDDEDVITMTMTMMITMTLTTMITGPILVGCLNPKTAQKNLKKSQVRLVSMQSYWTRWLTRWVVIWFNLIWFNFVSKLFASMHSSWTLMTL